MRIRTIKPEWLDDEKLCGCSTQARLLSIVLIVMADDHGNSRMGPEVVVATRAFPSEPDPVSAFRAAFSELEPWFVSSYSENGQGYYHVENWNKHQRIDNAGKPLCPPPPLPPPPPQEEMRARDHGRGLGRGPGPGPGPAANRGESPQVAASRGEPPSLMPDSRPMGEERDQLLEVCAEYGLAWGKTPPDLMEGDHQRRFLVALRDPSGGIAVLLQAVRGHHVQASREGSKVGKELRHVVPPATSHGQQQPHVPDMTRVLEYAASCPAAKAQEGKARHRRMDPPPGKRCRDCQLHLQCVERPSVGFDPDSQVCCKPGEGWYQ